MVKSRNVIGHLLALFTAVVWGTTFISTKVLLETFSAVEILFIRFILGYLALWLAYPRWFKIKDKKQELLFAASGLTGVVLYFLLENIALTYTLASNVGVIISIAPMCTAILAHFLLEGERLKLSFFIGFAVSMTGIFLISFSGTTVLKLNPLGDILTIGAAMMWAIYSILIKKISNLNYNNIQATRRVFFYALLFMIPVLFLFNFQWKIEALLEPKNLFNIIYLGIGASALCFVTWNHALKVLGVIKTSVYIYAGPVITVVSSALILQEKITGVAIIGTVLTIAGLFLSESKINLLKERAMLKWNK